MVDRQSFQYLTELVFTIESVAAGACQPGRVRCREDVQLGGGRAVRVGAPVLQRGGGRRGGGVQGAALTEVGRPAAGTP